MVTTSERVAGTSVCPERLEPQATTRPSAVSAKLCFPPAATATTLLSPAGTFACPSLFRPQATTVPSALKARLWVDPAEMAMTLDALAGTAVCPYWLTPQATTTVWVCAGAVMLAANTRIATKQLPGSFKQKNASVLTQLALCHAQAESARATFWD